MEMDWKPNASRDFSLVVWSDGAEAVNIVSDISYSDTIRGDWVLTDR